MAAPELTVVIPTYNNPEGAIDLVSDFYRLHNPDTFRIISIDQTLDGIKFRDKEPVHLHIRTHRNLGFSKAVNTGWKLVTTPFTLLANDDVRLLDSRWYDEAKIDLDHQDILATNPYPATRTWDQYGNAVWFWDDTTRDGKRDDRLDFIKDKPFEQYTREDYDRIKQVHGSGVGNGTAMFFTLLKTNARNYVGLLDEAYWNNGEDYDWNRRCFLTCWKCKRRRSEHELSKGALDSFEPFRILTSKNSYIHHQAGVTKQKAMAKGEGSTYASVVMAKNIFNDKWGTPDCPAPGIYGTDGTFEPNSPWWIEVPL